MPDLLLLCYDWFCLEGEKNKKKIVTLQMLLSIQEISAWFKKKKKKINIKKKKTF